MAISLVLPGTVGALEYNYGLGYGVERSDNIRLAPTDKQEEWIHSVNAGFSLQETGRALDARIASRGEYRKYRKNVFPDESLFGLNLSATLHVLPERFTWSLEDVYNQTFTDPFVSETPDNRQNTNVYSTGPDYFIRLNPRHTLQIGARFGESWYDKVELDGERSTTYGRWLFQASRRTQLSLNYETESVDYKNEVLNTNFVRRDVFFGLANQVSRNTVELNLGTTRIHRDRADDVKGNSGNLSWTREITTESSFSLSMAGELSDTGRETLATEAVSDQPVSLANAVSGDVFFLKSADITFSQRRSFGSNSLRIFANEKEYKLAAANNEKTYGGNVDIGYDFSQFVTCSVFAGLSEVEYPRTAPLREDKDKNSGIRVTYRLGRNVSLGFEAKRSKRESTIATSNYIENRYGLNLAYNSNYVFRR